MTIAFSSQSGHVHVLVLIFMLILYVDVKFILLLSLLVGWSPLP